MSKEKYLQFHAPSEQKETIENLLNSAINIIPLITKQNRSTLASPKIRIIIDDKPYAEGQTFAIAISSGMIMHCINIAPPPVESTIPSLHQKPIDKKLCSETMLKWVVAHEWMHSIRMHNEVITELGNTSKIRRALEWDADLCAAAIIHRQIQNTYSGIMSDIEVRQLTLHSIYWSLRDLNFYKGDEDHDSFSTRLYDIIIKINTLNESPFITPKTDETRIMPLISTISLCEEFYLENRNHDDDQIDFRDEIMRLGFSGGSKACETWDEIRSVVGRISSTLA